MGWGIGVLFHGLSAYVFPNYSAITDELVRKEMEKTDNTQAKQIVNLCPNKRIYQDV